MRKFPVWLLCLLLFALLLALAVFLISSSLLPMPPAELPARSGDGVSVIFDGELPDKGASPLPASDGSVPVTGAPLSDPAPAATPTPTPAPTPTPVPTPEPVHIHHYVNGRCAQCGQAPVFFTDSLPEELFTRAQHEGSVMLCEYQVPFYGSSEGGLLDKCFNIYLPWGYDENSRYNVLVLIPGADGDQDSWLNSVYSYDEQHDFCGRMLLDRMFELGYAEPCIVAAPVMTTETLRDETAGNYQMRLELREFILPYLAENYATYAESGSLEDIAAARDHFALGGLSNGAIFVFDHGMRYNFDLFGSYMALSGNYSPWDTASAIRNGSYAGLPVRCLFTGAGADGDWQQENTKIGYDFLLENDARLVDGETAFHVDVSGGHEWKVWFTDLCNALPLLFP